MDVGKVVLQHRKEVALLVVGHHGVGVLEQVVQPVKVPHMAFAVINQPFKAVVAVEQEVVRPRQRVGIVRRTVRGVGRVEPLLTGFYRSANTTPSNIHSTPRRIQ